MSCTAGWQKSFADEKNISIRNSSFLPGKLIKQSKAAFVNPSIKNV